MEEIEDHREVTYGGEIEVLAVDCNTGSLSPLEATIQQQIQTKLDTFQDNAHQPINIDVDQARHIIEFRGAVSTHLPHLVTSYCSAIENAHHHLKQHANTTFLSSSFHPFEDPASAYKNVTPKPIYDLFRGPFNGTTHVHPSVLQKLYTTSPEKGRGWNHEIGATSASIQPWNSLHIEKTASQIAILQATGWMFNLLTANSPLFKGNLTGKRDFRLSMWGEHGMIASSRYPLDQAMTQNLPERPTGLTDYYGYVLSHQRPMVIPHPEQKNSSNAYKLSFLGVIQPQDDQEFTMLTCLLSDHIKTVDIKTGEEYKVAPGISHLCNGFDFLYWPGHGARIRLQLPQADQIDPTIFVKAIREKDEKLFLSLLLQGGIQDGFLCAEGRVPASVLPTREHPGWERLSIPFVLQTALLRSAHDLLAFLDTTPLTWNDLTHILPMRSNETQHGFHTHVKGVHITELAQHIWAIAKKRLTIEEHQLVGNAIDEILSKQMAPAEEQIALFETLHQQYSHASALQRFVEHMLIETTDVSTSFTKEKTGNLNREIN